MARLEFEDFFEKELERVYIAGRVNEADGVEEALTQHGIDYAVAVEPYLTRSLGLFTSTYSGIAFYVLSGQAAAARSILLAAGLARGIADAEASP